MHNEQQDTALTLTTGSMRMYGGTACTLVGSDERNGRINPALEINDDEIDLTEMKRRKASRTASQDIGTTRRTSSQNQTAL